MKQKMMNPNYDLMGQGRKFMISMPLTYLMKEWLNAPSHLG